MLHPHVITLEAEVMRLLNIEGETGDLIESLLQVLFHSIFYCNKKWQMLSFPLRIRQLNNRIQADIVLLQDARHVMNYAHGIANDKADIKSMIPRVRFVLSRIYRSAERRDKPLIALAGNINNVGQYRCSSRLSSCTFPLLEVAFLF